MHYAEFREVLIHTSIKAAAEKDLTKLFRFLDSCRSKLVLHGGELSHEDVATGYDVLSAVVRSFPMVPRKRHRLRLGLRAEHGCTDSCAGHAGARRVLHP